MIWYCIGIGNVWKSSTGSPKVTIFKQKKNISKIELLEATRALKKDQEEKKKQEEEEEEEHSPMTGNNVTADKPPNLECNESDEELLQATIELEHLQLAKEDQEGALLVIDLQGAELPIVPFGSSSFLTVRQRSN